MGPQGNGSDGVVLKKILEELKKLNDVSDSNPRKITRLIYLVPIFLGLYGGILMYIAVKDQDQEMANNAILYSLMSTVGWIFLSFMMYVIYWNNLYI